MARDWTAIPIIDIAPLSGAGATAVAAAIGKACQSSGFFYIVGHGVEDALVEHMEALSREFFALPLAEKMAIAMAKGGRAWRGYFPVGGELTSGLPDRKEGLYLGRELPPEHPDVQAALPMHGANLFPAIPGFRDTVLAYIAALTALGHRLMAGLALSLGLDASYFDRLYTHDPFILLRLFHYPPEQAGEPASWGVGEHTDYGILTILKQDAVGGLEVKSRERWIAAPVIPGSFICNIGDMLDRMTGGFYRSTPHRVRNVSGRERYSIPFFFDPNFHAAVQPIPTVPRAPDDQQQRWDQASVHSFSGTYGDYLLAKVAKVFPELQQAVLKKPR